MSASSLHLDYKQVPAHLAFCMGSGDWTQTFTLVQQVWTGWVISLTPHCEQWCSDCFRFDWWEAFQDTFLHPLPAPYYPLRIVLLFFCQMNIFKAHFVNFSCSLLKSLQGYGYFWWRDILRNQDLGSKFDHCCLSIGVAGCPSQHIHAYPQISGFICMVCICLCIHTKKQTHKWAAQLTVVLFPDKFTVSWK